MQDSEDTKCFFWACSISPEEPFSFGDLPKNCCLHLQGANITVRERELIDKTELPKHLKSKIVDKGQKNISKEKGLVLQVAILDENISKRKKFVLGTLKTETCSSIKLDLYFDDLQIPNVSFEAKGRPHLNRQDCFIDLFGTIMAKGDDLTSETFFANKSQEIKDKMILERKLLPKRHKPVSKPDESDEEIPEPEQVNSRYMKEGISILNFVVGFGRRAKKGDKVTIHFKGKLDPTKSKCFDKTKLGKPFSFILGSKKVIRGIHIGVEGMTKNGKREMVIPSGLAFGSTGFDQKVPPNSTCYYDIELVDVLPRKKLAAEKLKNDQEKQRKKADKVRKENEYMKDKDVIEL
jgi:FKBP-type peptidyl-prolyl cis-trans isomerase